MRRVYVSNPNDLAARLILALDGHSYSSFTKRRASRAPNSIQWLARTPHMRKNGALMAKLMDSHKSPSRQLRLHSIWNTTHSKQLRSFLRHSHNEMRSHFSPFTFYLWTIAICVDYSHILYPSSGRVFFHSLYSSICARADKIVFSLRAMAGSVRSFQLAHVLRHTDLGDVPQFPPPLSLGASSRGRCLFRNGFLNISNRSSSSSTSNVMMAICECRTES